MFGYTHRDRSQRWRKLEKTKRLLCHRSINKVERVQGASQSNWIMISADNSTAFENEKVFLTFSNQVHQTPYARVKTSDLFLQIDH